MYELSSPLEEESSERELAPLDLLERPRILSEKPSEFEEFERFRFCFLDMGDLDRVERSNEMDYTVQVF